MRTSLLSIFLLVCILSSAQDDAPAEQYGNSVISLSPLTTYGSDGIGDLGLGLGYERFLNDYVSLKLNANYGLINDMAQVVIGPKFYPADHDKPVAYSISPTFVFTTSEEEVYNGYIGIFPDPGPPYSQHRHYQFGFMLINSLNATLNERVYFGIDAGLGVNYYNVYELSDGSLSESDPSSSGMFNIAIGYRL